MESPHKPQKPTCVCVCVCVCGHTHFSFSLIFFLPNQVTFEINFDFNLNQLEKQAVVNFEVQR